MQNRIFQSLFLFSLSLLFSVCALAAADNSEPLYNCYESLMNAQSVNGWCNSQIQATYNIGGHSKPYGDNLRCYINDNRSTGLQCNLTDQWQCPEGTILKPSDTNPDGVCADIFVDRADQCDGTNGQGNYATINGSLRTVSCSDGPSEDCTNNGGVIGSTATYNYCQFNTEDTSYDHQTQEFVDNTNSGGGGGDTGGGDTGTGDTGTGDTGTGDTGTGDTGTGGTGTGDTGTGTGGSTGTGDQGAGDCDPTATNYLDCLITSDYSEGEGGSFSSAGEDALQQATDEYEALIASIKSQAESLLSVNVGQGGSIQPAVYKVFGVDVDFSWSKFSSLLVILGNIFFAVAAIISAFIILKR